MPRPRRKPFTVSLFPFLSVLACVIGVLCMLVVMLGLLQFASGGDAKYARELDRLTQEHDSNLAEMEVLEQEIREARDVADELHAVEEDNKALNDLANSPPSESTVQARRDELKQLDADLENARDEANAARAELKRASAPQTPTIRILPAGTGNGSSATFLECERDLVIVYQPGQEPVRVPTQDFKDSAAYQQLRQSMKDASDGLLIFLIRPDAVATYEKVASIAEGNGIRTAKLPLPDEGPVNLEEFRGFSSPP